MKLHLFFGNSLRDLWNFLRSRPVSYESFEKIPITESSNLDEASVIGKTIVEMSFLKWEHYFPIYTRVWNELRSHPSHPRTSILEIGIDRGGSLQLWRELFGIESRIFGIDINPACSSLSDSTLKVRIGSQNDSSFLEAVVSEMEQVDLIIDDGSHSSSDIIKSFTTLFPYLSDGGIYLVEDTHASYWTSWNLKGGLRRHNSSIEYFKNIIDVLHQPYFRMSASKRQWKNSIPKEIGSIEFFDSIVIVRKNKKIGIPRLVEVNKRSVKRS